MNTLRENRVFPNLSSYSLGTGSARRRVFLPLLDVTGLAQQVPPRRRLEDHRDQFCLKTL